MNKVQQCAYELIKNDAKAIYTLITVLNKDNKLDSNYICMSIPYVAIFTYEYSKWANTLKLDIPQFSEKEKEYYEKVRSKHKLFNVAYKDVVTQIENVFYKADKSFSSMCNPIARLLNVYDNIGVDIINNRYCGNTILCEYYNDFLNDDYSNGIEIKELSIVIGKLISNLFLGKVKVIKYISNTTSTVKDCNYYRNFPIKTKDINNLVLFSILCSINFMVEFIDKVFTDDITSKLRWGYLQYYYLVDFIKEVNENNRLQLEIDENLYNKKFRNCMAHYGLGVILKEENIIEEEKFVGLTQLLFNLTYLETKEFIFQQLKSLAVQIENLICL